MDSLVGILPLILLVGVFYFLLIRPQQKRQQQHKKLLQAIEPGDEVVTIGGAFGDVVDIDDDRILLELYDGTQIEFLRSAVSRRVIAETEDESGDKIDVTDDDDELVEDLQEKGTDAVKAKTDAVKAKKDKEEANADKD